MWSRHSLAGARCSTTGELRATSLVPNREQTATPRRTSPVAAYFHHTRPVPRGVVSTLARWRSLLDHRRGPAAPAAPGSRPRRPAPYLSPSLRLSHHPRTCNRGGVVSTLARWRSLLDHRRGQPPCATREADRHPAPYLLPSLRLSTTRHLQPRGVVSTLARWRSLLDHRRAFAGLAARPPESRPRSLLDHGLHLRLLSRRLTSWCDPRGPAGGARRRGSRRRGPRTCGARRARTGRGRRCAGRSRCLGAAGSLTTTFPPAVNPTITTRWPLVALIGAPVSWPLSKEIDATTGIPTCDETLGVAQGRHPGHERVVRRSGRRRRC